MSKYLKSREKCPVHQSYWCEPCHKPKPKRNLFGRKKPDGRMRLSVEIIEDSHYPGGFREVCTKVELRRRKHLVIERQSGRCNHCHKKFESIFEVELDHVLNSKMGAAFKNDALDNLQALCHGCHEIKTGLPQWSVSA